MPADVHLYVARDSPWAAGGVGALDTFFPWFAKPEVYYLHKVPTAHFTFTLPSR